MEPLNPLERVTPNVLGYLDNPGPDSLFQLTDGQFRPSTRVKDGMYQFFFMSKVMYFMFLFEACIMDAMEHA
jgi:hypothetical protein